MASPRGSSLDDAYSEFLTQIGDQARGERDMYAQWSGVSMNSSQIRNLSAEVERRKKRKTKWDTSAENSHLAAEDVSRGVHVQEGFRDLQPDYGQKSRKIARFQQSQMSTDVIAKPQWKTSEAEKTRGMKSTDGRKSAENSNLAPEDVSRGVRVQKGFHDLQPDYGQKSRKIGRFQQSQISTDVIAKPQWKMSEAEKTRGMKSTDGGFQTLSKDVKELSKDFGQQLIDIMAKNKREGKQLAPDQLQHLMSMMQQQFNETYEKQQREPSPPRNTGSRWSSPLSIPDDRYPQSRLAMASKEVPAWLSPGARSSDSEKPLSWHVSRYTSPQAQQYSSEMWPRTQTQTESFSNLPQSDSDKALFSPKFQKYSSEMWPRTQTQAESFSKRPQSDSDKALFSPKPQKYSSEMWSPTQTQTESFSNLPQSKSGKGLFSPSLMLDLQAQKQAKRSSSSHKPLSTSRGVSSRLHDPSQPLWPAESPSSSWPSEGTLPSWPASELSVQPAQSLRRVSRFTAQTSEAEHDTGADFQEGRREPVEVSKSLSLASTQGGSSLEPAKKSRQKRKRKRQRGFDAGSDPVPHSVTKQQPPGYMSDSGRGFDDGMPFSSSSLKTGNGRDQDPQPRGQTQKQLFGTSQRGLDKPRGFDDGIPFSSSSLKTGNGRDQVQQLRGQTQKQLFGTSQRGLDKPRGFDDGIPFSSSSLKTGDGRVQDPQPRGPTQKQLFGTSQQSLDIADQPRGVSLLGYQGTGEERSEESDEAKLKSAKETRRILEMRMTAGNMDLDTARKYQDLYRNLNHMISSLEGVVYGGQDEPPAKGLNVSSGSIPRSDSLNSASSGLSWPMAGVSTSDVGLSGTAGNRLSQIAITSPEGVQPSRLSGPYLGTFSRDAGNQPPYTQTPQSHVPVSSGDPSAVEFSYLAQRQQEIIRGMSKNQHSTQLTVPGKGQMQGYSNAYQPMTSLDQKGIGHEMMNPGAGTLRQGPVHLQDNRTGFNVTLKDGEAARKSTDMVSGGQSQLSLPTKPAKLPELMDVFVPPTSESILMASQILKVKQEQKPTKVKKKSEEYSRECEVCSVMVNSVEAFKSHLAGKKHKAQVQKAAEKQVTDAAKKEKTLSLFQYKDHPKECKVCGISLTNEAAYLQHKIGKRHKVLVERASLNEKYPMFEEKPTQLEDILRYVVYRTKSDQLVCLVCDTNCTSVKVLETHLNGIRHAEQLETLQKLKSVYTDTLTRGFDVTALAKPNNKNILKCTLCDVVCPGVKNFEMHMNGNKHKARVTEVEGPKIPGIQEALIPITKQKSSTSAVGAEVLKTKQAELAGLTVGERLDKVISNNYCMICCFVISPGSDHVATRKHKQNLPMVEALSVLMKIVEDFRDPLKTTETLSQAETIETKLTSVNSAVQSQSGMAGCAVCDLSFATDVNIKQHMMGSKHFLMMEASDMVVKIKQSVESGQMKGLQDLLMEYKKRIDFTATESNDWLCYICKLKLGTEMNYEAHQNCARHHKIQAFLVAMANSLKFLIAFILTRSKEEQLKQKSTSGRSSNSDQYQKILDEINVQEILSFAFEERLSKLHHEKFCLLCCIPILNPIEDHMEMRTHEAWFDIYERIGHFRKIIDDLCKPSERDRAFEQGSQCEKVVEEDELGQKRRYCSFCDASLSTDTYRYTHIMGIKHILLKQGNEAVAMATKAVKNEDICLLKNLLEQCKKRLEMKTVTDGVYYCYTCETNINTKVGGDTVKRNELTINSYDGHIKSSQHLIKMCCAQVLCQSVQHLYNVRLLSIRMNITDRFRSGMVVDQMVVGSLSKGIDSDSKSSGVQEVRSGMVVDQMVVGFSSKGIDSESKSSGVQEDMLRYGMVADQKQMGSSSKGIDSESSGVQEVMLRSGMVADQKQVGSVSEPSKGSASESSGVQEVMQTERPGGGKDSSKTGGGGGDESSKTGEGGGETDDETMDMDISDSEADSDAKTGVLESDKKGSSDTGSLKGMDSGDERKPGTKKSMLPWTGGSGMLCIDDLVVTIQQVPNRNDKEEMKDCMEIEETTEQEEDDVVKIQQVAKKDDAEEMKDRIKTMEETEREEDVKSDSAHSSTQGKSMVRSGDDSHKCDQRIWDGQATKGSIKQEQDLEDQVSQKTALAQVKQETSGNHGQDIDSESKSDQQRQMPDSDAGDKSIHSEKEGSVDVSEMADTDDDLDRSADDEIMDGFDINLLEGEFVVIDELDEETEASDDDDVGGGDQETDDGDVGVDGGKDGGDRKETSADEDEEKHLLAGYSPGIAYGKTFIKPGKYCLMCEKFIQNPKVANEDHCKTKFHCQQVEKHTKELKQKMRTGKRRERRSTQRQGRR